MDNIAKNKEIPLIQIERIADEAIFLGALWCLITGGEPLLRKDFFNIYLALKKKGLLVSIFTNATLITKEHINVFKKYPPRDIEVTVYGVTESTYERVSRVPGSFKAFRYGLDLLLKNDIRVRFKTMALRSNVHELDKIAKFCRERTKDYFRFDPFLHLRFDANLKGNEDIKAERLSPEEVVAIEHADLERSVTLKQNCDKLIIKEMAYYKCNYLFHCGAGNGSFYVTYDGFYKLCSSLCQKDCVYDLKKGTVVDAWNNFVGPVRDMRSDNKEFLQKCRKCELINLCMWCPAHAHLETGDLGQPVKVFCDIAHARAEALKYGA